MSDDYSTRPEGDGAAPEFSRKRGLSTSGCRNRSEVPHVILGTQMAPRRRRNGRSSA